MCYKGLCNNYLEWRGGWEIREGGIGENDNKREGELDVHTGGITFSFFFANWKK